MKVSCIVTKKGRFPFDHFPPLVFGFIPTQKNEMTTNTVKRQKRKNFNFFPFERNLLLFLVFLVVDRRRS